METEFEQILMNAYKVEMVAYLDSHPECFQEAINLAIIDKQPYSWRAAWLMWDCMEDNDERIKANIDNIINAITDKGDGHQRDLVRILIKMDLDEEHEGYVFNICMDIWEKIGKKPSVRFNALRFIVKTAKKHPDLCNEVSFLTQDQYLDSLSPGVKNSARRMINGLPKI